MRVYLDNCSLNRPFDDQSQFRIRLETEAKLFVQRKIREGELEFAWSYVLDYENQANPFGEQCDYFLTTDDKILNKMKNSSEIRVVDPIAFVREVNL